MSYLIKSSEEICLDDGGMEVKLCWICGKPIEENEGLCLDCQIEKLILECTAQIEM